MDNVPVLQKCCFCVPLRYGLLTWGYLKLAASLVGLVFYLYVVIILSYYIRRDDVFTIAIITLLAIVLTTEVVFHILFIIGAHKKHVKLLRVYYYYALFMWVVTVIGAAVATVFLILNFYDHPSEHVQIGLVTLGVFSFIFSIVVQTFLVLSLRSEIIKLRGNCPYKFVIVPSGSLSFFCDDGIDRER